MGWYEFDGHEVAVVTTVVGGMVLVNRTMHKGWVRSLIHRQPVASMSLAWAFIGITLPLVVPPIRRKLGLPTNQYDAEHPDTVSVHNNYLSCCW